jgi:hypothetical protein
MEPGETEQALAALDLIEADCEFLRRFAAEE